MSHISRRTFIQSLSVIPIAIGMVAVAVFGQKVSAQSFIVEDGQANAEIVITENPPRTTRVAAWELQTYVEKISGARLPIVHTPADDVPVTVYVGVSSHTEDLGITDKGLKYGAYRIVSGDDWLVLIGDDTNFTPVEPYTRNRSQRGSREIIEAWDAVSDGIWGHPAGNTFKTLFRNFDRFRGRDTGEERLDLWAFDERGSFNAVCRFLRDLGVRWYMPGELGEIVPERASVPLPDVDKTMHPDFPIRDCNVRFGVHDRRVSMWAMRLGMRQPHGVGWAHGLTGVTGRAEMKQAHPEYYALYAGKRATGVRKSCLSSPELFRQTVSYARTLFDHYDSKVVSVMPADGYTSLCQCPLCEGKDSPDQPYRGRMSDYVWGFVTRVANAVAETHPGRRIGNMAYNLYRIPPQDIETLPDNVVVGIVGGRRPTAIDPDRRKQIRELRQGWAEKTDNRILNFENYPLTARGYWLPAFTPHTNAASVNAVKGLFLGENIQPSAHRFMEAAALNSFKFYVTFRMYWGGKDRDIDPILNEFYRLFYGPAEKQMKSFYEYCEAHFPEMRKEKAKADKALALFEEARQQVSDGSVYDKRLGVMDDYLDALRERSKQIAKEQKRENVPEVQMWRGASTVEIDGKLDDDYWQNKYPWRGRSLQELETGRKPVFGTSFKVAWGRDSIYFAIRCEDKPGESLNIATERDEDAAIWMGDNVELLIETEKNSYYQIAINPSGAIADLNRADGKKTFRWDSQAEVGTHIGEDYWTVEVRLPVIEDTNDPFHQIIGRRPQKDLSWYFNVCRQRVREHRRELSAFSPTGEKSFHVPSRFAKLYK